MKDIIKKDSDLGLLIIRVGVGIAMIAHGWPKLIAGPEKWERLGGAMSNLGISFFPEFWGLAAALAEVLGGVFLAAGIFYQPALLSLAFTMLVAMIVHINKGDGFKGYSHAMKLMILFAGMTFIGPGKYVLRIKK